MKIYLADLKDEQGNYINYHFLIKPGSIKIENENFSFKDSITLYVSASYTGRALNLKGYFKTKIELSCSRCLNSFIYLLESDFQEKFQHISSESEKEPFHEDFFRGEAFNLAGILRENIILALPLKPVCSSNCKGLCPVCGQNLNTAKCNCEVLNVDPRLEGLKKLLEK